MIVMGGILSGIGLLMALVCLVLSIATHTSTDFVIIGILIASAGLCLTAIGHESKRQEF